MKKFTRGFQRGREKICEKKFRAMFLDMVLDMNLCVKGNGDKIHREYIYIMGEKNGGIDGKGA